jgi:hypothetical protein
VSGAAAAAQQGDVTKIAIATAGKRAIVREQAAKNEIRRINIWALLTALADG